MKMTIARRENVERHHSAENRPILQSLAQDRGITDTILQADDDGIAWSVLHDRIGHRRGVGALDRDEDNARVSKNGIVLGKQQPVRRHSTIEPLETRQSQTIPLDVSDHSWTREQGNLAPCIGQHAADEAADAAGAGNDNGSGRAH